MSRKPKATGVEARVIADLPKWMPLISEDAGNDLSRKAVIARLSDEIAKRQQLGRKKYPTTLARNPARFVERVRHAAEESWDGLAYMQWAMEGMESADFLQWAADHPRESAWIQQQEISLLRMQRLLACLLTRLLMAAEAADLKAPPMPEDLQALAKRIPFRLRRSMSGRNRQQEYTNADLGIWVTRITYGCPKADRQGHWRQSSKRPKVSCGCIADGRMHGEYPSVSALLQDLPGVARAAAKLYPPKGGQDA